MKSPTNYHNYYKKTVNQIFIYIYIIILDSKKKNS